MGSNGAEAWIQSYFINESDFDDLNLFAEIMTNKRCISECNLDFIIFVQQQYSWFITLDFFVFQNLLRLILDAEAALKYSGVTH